MDNRKMPREIKNNYGTIRINEQRVNKPDCGKFKLTVITTALVVTISLSAIVGGLIGRNSVKPEVNLIPNDCIMLNLPIEIDAGEDIYDYASKYYTDDYTGVYSSVENYKDAIKKANDIKNDTVNYDQTVFIPVVVDAGNEYFLTVQSLKDQIREIEENEFWVDYTVQMGDTVSALAAQSSDDYNEMYEYIDLILKKNGIDEPASIQIGTTIKIINPKLGNLKNDLNENMEMLLKSIQNNKTK